jgi:hypothetical protein
VFVTCRKCYCYLCGRLLEKNTIAFDRDPDTYLYVIVS